MITNALALGLGVQSTALYMMGTLGEMPRVDYAVFSDIGREGRKTYLYLDWLLKWAQENGGPPIIVKNQRNLFLDLLKNTNNRGERIASIPAFTMSDGKEGMLRRQCTNEYKIVVVNQTIREMYGLQARQRNIQTNIWKGISSNEADRMSLPEDKWQNFIYPFCGYGIPGKGKWFKLQGDLYRPMSRLDIIAWYKRRGLPVPPKSSCVFCPYHSDATWADMRDNEPDDFADAVMVDKAIRDSSKRGVNQPIFLHRSLKPLDEVNFDPNSKIEFGECSGTCNT
jgi:hypothetical protein